MFIALSIMIVLSITSFTILSQIKFGQPPSGDRLERIKKSPNYKDGAFQNISETPVIAEEASTFGVFVDFIFGKKERVTPIDTIPSIKTDLLNLNPEEKILVWFGHSSYFIQIDGKKFLIDPVFSPNASPVSFTTKAYNGTNRYTVEDLPAIDYLIITHDHWDHLDYETVTKLQSKTAKVICPLGVGEHFEYWKYPNESIIEMDWNEEFQSDSLFKIHCTPARHFSGRGLKRNQSLWASYVLQTPSMNIFIGGDGGYDTHFAQIGKKFGSIDLAIIENGQYNTNWRYIHLLPNEISKVYNDLNAKKLLAVHSSKFTLANHSWDEPLELVSELSKKENLNLITPMIGEQVNLKDSTQQFSQWWKGVN